MTEEEKRMMQDAQDALHTMGDVIKQAVNTGNDHFAIELIRCRISWRSDVSEFTKRKAGNP